VRHPKNWTNYSLYVLIYLTISFKEHQKKKCLVISEDVVIMSNRFQSWSGFYKGEYSYEEQGNSSDIKT
jgi:hypothetical protein